MENQNVNVNEVEFEGGANSTEQVKTYTQEEVNELLKGYKSQEEVNNIVNKRLAREKKDIEARIEAEKREAERLATMSAEEKSKHELEKRIAELEAREREIAKKGGIADFLPIVAIDVSIVSFGCAFGYANVARAMFFPIILFIYGVVAVFLRYKWGKEESEKTSLEYLLPVISGVLLALVFKKMGRAYTAYWATVLGTLCVAFLAGAILSIFKRGTKIGEQGRAVSFCGTAFYIITSLLVPSTLISVMFLFGAGVTGLAPVLAKYLR